MVGKTNVPVVPDAVPVESGCAAQGVPLAVMGEAAAVSDLLEKSAHANQRVSQSMRQLGEHPARAAME